MSADATHTDAEFDRTVQPDTVFEEYIWHNPECCSNCFARCRVFYEDTHAQGMSVKPVISSYRTDDAELGQDHTDHDDYGVYRTYAAATTCSNCGSVRLLHHHDVMSRAEMTDCVDALVERLDEQGIDAHAEAMKRFIGEAKSKPDLRGYDYEIFERAVAFGIRWARRSRPTS